MESSKPAEDGSARAAILSALATVKNGEHGLSAADLASRVGVHVTTVRFHLDRLAHAGLLTSKVDPEHTVGRPSRRYTLVARSTVREGSAGDQLRMLAGLLSEAFRLGPNDEQVSPELAGERWASQIVPELLGLRTGDRAPAQTPGEWLSKVGMVVDLLLAWGYDPLMTTSDGGSTACIRLRDCPFLEAARADQDVICGTHLGLLRGILRELGEPDSGVALEPFTDPPLCLVNLTRHAHANQGSNP